MFNRLKESSRYSCRDQWTSTSMVIARYPFARTLLIRLLVYVSAVWLTYYKCRLLLLDLIFKCSKRLHEDENQLLKERTHAEIFARKIISCIPFHLVQDPGSVLQEHNSGYNALSVGRPLGGLLIMHPLHIGSKSSVVPESLQDHMRKCLAWIGENMGIGQARLLSKVRKERMQ